MSIIIDALKKAEKLRGKKTSETTSDGSSPSSPALVLDDKMPTIKLVGLIAAFVFLVMGILTGGYYTFFGGDSTKTATVDKPETIETKPQIEAKEEVVEESESTDDPETLITEALAAFDQGNLADSQQNWESLTQAMPNNAEVYNNHGLVSKKLGQFVKARESYEKALELNPNYTEALNNLGSLNIIEQDYEKAEAYLLKAIEANPDYTDAHFNLGLLYEKMKKPQNSVNHYEKFLSLEPPLLNKDDVKLAIELRIAQQKSLIHQ